jgi:hypothetical protein
MKTKKINKKLVLTKKTIANLSGAEMNVQRGGEPSDVCTLYLPRCIGITKRDCPPSVVTDPYMCYSDACRTQDYTNCPACD